MFLSLPLTLSEQNIKKCPRVRIKNKTKQNKNSILSPWPVSSISLRTRESRVRFLLRARTSIAVCPRPRLGLCERQPLHVSLSCQSFSLSLPPSLPPSVKKKKKVASSLLHGYQSQLRTQALAFHHKAPLFFATILLPWHGRLHIYNT
uniref:Uncharacterized protein n=1 Tax=Molossus molossus TaxID=27622 RepID=A0A7J8DBZ6_MOLMO|nr:hypothetical protein HJG59_009388 [Molossus molossus]